MKELVRAEQTAKPGGATHSARGKGLHQNGFQIA